MLPLSGAPSQGRRPKNRPLIGTVEQGEMPPSTVLQMPPAPSSSKSGLVLGVCCDQLMAVQPVQRASGAAAAAAKSSSPDWGNQRAKHLEGAVTTIKWIPPFFIILATLLEILVFLWVGADPPEDSLLVYRPDQRLQLWRFLSYALLHASWLHLGYNVLTQLLFGVPLELVHGSLRTGIIYMAGVLAGSLGTSVVDSEVYLLGASGGVYALLAAQLASLLLNFGQMRHGVFQLMAVILFVFCDLGYALYSRELAMHQLQTRPSVSYIAHMTGALAGISVGLLLLRQLDGGLRPRPLRWLALGVWCLFSAFGIAFNLVNTVTAQLLAEEEGQVIRQHLMKDLGMG
ncbi:protein rhomboid [Drosophila santomea]|uniref:protein rhomboid n=1 Tax=Drosophila santomea TaxID=129105 RepID=UPI001952D2BC|nr:protein rhomboid [Drosophila santomea]XP_039485480.1 protein rhomboid [Drosophila santomea]XP_039485481.1 protein rhomboid [Drosophila santomea]XP_039485482.1 protein rhomboid [Drosophila santomea]